MTVEIFEPHFLPDVPDTMWLPEVSQRGWFVLTKDDKIGRNSWEQIAIAQSQARVFILAIGNLPGREMGKIFAEALPKMQRIAQSHRSPFIAKVYEDGKVRMWQDRKRLNNLLAQFEN
ncbi:PIN-like domain-containing protein [Phormidesmis priestleyi]